MRIELRKITPVKMLFILLTLCVPFIACDKDDNPITERTFTVTIENVSTSTTLQPGALPDRTAPLTPGLWAVIDDNGTLFMLDTPADLGTERLAEEGSTAEKIADINGETWLEDHGTFMAAGGANGPIIGSGESATFTFVAGPGDELQIMTMFGQSNDWFYAFSGSGLELFDNADNAIDGNVTSEIVLYDAGTEADEMPGLGVTQKPDHPTTIDVGLIDPVDLIKVATSRHTTFTIPPTSSVIRVTITSTL